MYNAVYCVYTCLDRKWTNEKGDSHFCDQSKVFESVGKELISHSLDGYNCCLMAYGQTGAGKSYTMMGTKKEPGLIPQIAQEMILSL